MFPNHINVICTLEVDHNTKYPPAVISEMPDSPSIKRRKLHTSREDWDIRVEDIPRSEICRSNNLGNPSSSTSVPDFLRDTAHRRRTLASLTKEVSPPPLRRATPVSSRATPTSNGATLQSCTPIATPGSSSGTPIVDLTTPPPNEQSKASQAPENASTPNTHIPFRLTHIPALPTNHTITLQSLLTPPTPSCTLTTVWCFNYIHSLPFIVSNLPYDTNLSTLRIHLVHGSWRTEDATRIRLEQDRLGHPYPGNVRLVSAYMPEPFGTHHSKMLFLFSVEEGGGREMARVIIHTANMIPFDWGNMTQSVWDSGWLPLLLPGTKEPPIGAEFKSELLRYLEAYGSSRTGELTAELVKFSFSHIRAAFIGSVPGRYKLSESHFGWPGLQRILRNTHALPTSVPGKVICQVSSIATLAMGSKDTWLTPIFLKALSVTAPSKPPPPKPEFSIIFPTPDEIRASINGYDSGGAVHMKAATPANLKQIDYMRPYLCRWSGSLAPISSRTDPAPLRLGGRAKAAPHIKTYIRYNEPTCQTISWALLTSANLSNQAWGSAPITKASRGRGPVIPGTDDEKEVRICSYEAGVIMYPGLFAEEGKEVVMKPLFHGEELYEEEGKIHVGIRVPYDLPLAKYKPGEMPWSPGGSYAEVDCLGRSYLV
ncbi:tyrosyl-DNA phosphodiesterase [Tirmania nivea]|nr:tyrosyl-DNA phosphodiesterase [Tirmania nivea]